MRAIATLLVSAVMLIGMAMTFPQQVQAQGDPLYAGEATCIGCHTFTTPTIVSEYLKNGHRYKLNPVENGVPNTLDGEDRSYPDGRLYYPLVGVPFAPATVTPPAGTSWNDFAYVIGGYGWKARFVRTNGRIYTDDAEAQQNLWNNSRVTYHEGEPNKLYNFACFQCHTTGGWATGSWNGVPADALGEFVDPGVTCEGCHGPGAAHAVNPSGVKPPNTGDFLRLERCGECHQRGGATNAIPASSGYIKHHEQVNEFRASKHGDGVGDELTCVSCHNQHTPLHYPDLAGENFEGISTTCENCHADKKIQLNGVDKPIQCIDCHMPKASKSALGTQIGNGWQGDVKSHIMAINTNPVTKTEALFTPDGGAVALDVDGLAAVTMDFACLQCHSNKSVEWAANYAPVLHSMGIRTSTDDIADLPKEFELLQNYPNPFNPTTTIRFDLPETADVTLDIFSVDGRLVQSMLNQTMPAGDHRVEINVEFLPSGNYIYRLKAGSFTQSKTMTLLK